MFKQPLSVITSPPLKRPQTARQVSWASWSQRMQINQKPWGCAVRWENFPKGSQVDRMFWPGCIANICLSGIEPLWGMFHMISVHSCVSKKAPCSELDPRWASSHIFRRQEAAAPGTVKDGDLPLRCHQTSLWNPLPEWRLKVRCEHHGTKWWTSQPRFCWCAPGESDMENYCKTPLPKKHRRVTGKGPFSSQMCSINFKQTWEWFNPINSRFAGWTSRTSHPFGCSNCQRQPSPCLSSQPLGASVTGSVQVRPCPAAVKPAQWLKVGCTYSSRAPGAHWTPPRSHGLVGNLLIVGTMQWGGFTVYQGDGIKLLPCTVF